MMTRWLMNPKHFRVSPTGDGKGNADSCYWGLPSIAASDPAYPPLGYWRGYVWGPLSILTYWSLAEPKYAHVPEVTQGRKAMVQQLARMQQRVVRQQRKPCMVVLPHVRVMPAEQWNDHRHICENFSPHKAVDECTGCHFYHWGALPALELLIEHGLYNHSMKTDDDHAQPLPRSLKGVSYDFMN